MKIKVTTRHIRLGHKRTNEDCALAWAIAEATAAPLVAVYHSQGRAFVDMGPDGGELPLPPECSRFMVAFDRSKRSVRPFSFELALPEVAA